MNIFVGNLSFDANESDVKNLFQGFGNVVSVTIVMEREKKAPKSRGFGFVEMPDEQQALSAITALNDKEFMGRVLVVNPSRPKTKAQAASSLRGNRQPKIAVEERGQKKNRFNSVLNKPGTFRGGRRTNSYMKRQGLVGIQEEAKPWRSNRQENPMRWRKRRDQPKPWQKSAGESKPWKKTEGEARPWKKAGGEHSQKPRFKGRSKPGGYKR
ncbi:MAG: hypothetical protein PHO70_03580 [Candidatus Omnitrophica bacterium]|nr:hypothetical protein [Candidatus Omnitrophota bacterium]